MGEQPKNSSIGLDEFGIIERHFAPLAGKRGKNIETFSLKDDAALVTSRPGKRIVVTSDSIVSGIHFFGDEAPGLIAQKALRTNLSDLASKAAVPVGYTLSLHLPNGIDDEWLAEFASGLASDQKTFNIQLLGGDTVGSPVLAIAITALGEVGAKYPARQNAKSDDDIYVTGTIGDAALGLKVRDGSLTGLPAKGADYLVDRYHLPQPRLAAQGLIAKHANASMDISDGLLGDLKKLCVASKLAASLEVELIPFSKAVIQAIDNTQDLNKLALTGGDDYELLFTARKADRNIIDEMAADLPFGVTRIGAMVRQSTQSELITLYKSDGSLLHIEAQSHQHRF